MASPNVSAWQRYWLKYWRAFFGRSMRWLERRGFHVYVVHLGTPDDHVEMPVLPEGYSVKAMSPQELLPWAEQTPGLSEQFLLASQARNDRCVVNFYADEVVGYGFVASEWAPINRQLRVHIRDSMFYRYKGWTHQQHRRKYLSHARGRLNSKLFEGSDATRMVSYVALHNYPSKLTHADIKPRRLGYCGFVTWFGRQYPFTQRGAREAGFQIERRDLAESV